MVRRNNQTNTLIKWLVIVGDFVLLNAVLYVTVLLNERTFSWGWQQQRIFFIISNMAMLMSEWKFHTIIHERVVSAGDVLKTIVLLTMTQAVVAYIAMRHLMYWSAAGWLVLETGTALVVLLVLLRLAERMLIKRMRRLGRNSRTVTLVGSDPEIRRVWDLLLNDPTMGYRITGYYADEEVEDAGITRIGTLAELMDDISNGREVDLGDELYVCLSRKESETITALSEACDRQVTKFFFVPVSVESIGLNLKREYINDIEIFTTRESPLDNPTNQFVKRLFDIVVSIVALTVTGLLFPIVWLMVKIQSPGPLFFRQLRTGVDGEDFQMVKFRSMHVNKDADKLQATKNDPRKFPFGNFMRKTNIDELPQFWNVLKGDMSVVGPRPHMLAHTEEYSKKIREYMVRHFVKPGITGWAQVTGYRGETKELWQMEGRVKRDIWYIEHWSIWLDIRIVWLTFKTFFVRDKNAY